MLDAIIANGDRHHENWGVVQVYGPQPHRYLAPSYDHASSLGREISDEERMVRLTGRDRRRTVDTYLRRARSAFYGSEAEQKPLSPVGAFRFAADLYPDDAAFWLARARDLRQHVVEEIVQAVPATAISDAARRFAVAVVTWSRAVLVGETP